MKQVIKVTIKCANEECAYHQEGFLYELEGGKLADDKDNNKAYDLVIDCPNGHQNKIWIIPEDIDDFLKDMVGMVIEEI